MAQPTTEQPQQGISLEALHHIIGRLTFNYEMQIAQLTEMLQKQQQISKDPNLVSTK